MGLAVDLVPVANDGIGPYRRARHFAGVDGKRRGVIGMLDPAGRRGRGIEGTGAGQPVLDAVESVPKGSAFALKVHANARRRAGRQRQRREKTETHPAPAFFGLLRVQRHRTDGVAVAIVGNTQRDGAFAAAQPHEDFNSPDGAFRRLKRLNGAIAAIERIEGSGMLGLHQVISVGERIAGLPMIEDVRQALHPIFFRGRQHAADQALATLEFIGLQKERDQAAYSAGKHAVVGAGQGFEKETVGLNTIKQAFVRPSRRGSDGNRRPTPPRCLRVQAHGHAA